MADAASRKTHRRERIIAAARKEFLANGFRAVDLAAFSAELGISKKTLYLEFESKRELVKAVLLDKLASVKAELERLASAGTASQGVQAGKSSLERILQNRSAHEIGEFLSLLQSHLQEIKVAFLRDLNKFYPELFEIVNKTRRETIPAHLERLIARGQRKGVVRKDLPRRALVDIILSAIESIMNPAKLEEMNLSPKEGFELLLSVLMEGALVKGGRLR